MESFKLFSLLFSIDIEILKVMLMTLQVSGTATIGSVLIGIPLVYGSLSRNFGESRR